MNAELIEAIRLLEKERAIDAEVLFEAIEDALVSAYKREFDAKTVDNIRAEVDRETGVMRVFLSKEVVETVEDPNSQISLIEAKALSEDFDIGDAMEYQLSPQDFGRLAAQTAKNIISQKINSAERERIQNEFSSKIGELATGVVQRKDRREVIVDIGRAEAILSQNEQVRTDMYNFNQRMKFYILKVDEKKGRPVIYVSRSHPNLVKKLFEIEVPEIADGIVEIVSISREAGSRSKIAVASRDENVDPVGSCVGQKGLRVGAIMDELKGEKIDIIEWDEDPVNYISNSLSPAKVLRVDINPDDRTARVIVPDQQLSLAIGREGQNARLAARLTGWRIDIRSESQFRGILESELMERFTQAAESVAEEDFIEDENETIDVKLEEAEMADVKLEETEVAEVKPEETKVADAKSEEPKKEKSKKKASSKE